MTTEVDRLVCKKTGTDMNLKSNHIQCFCHKLALIPNAGLKAIDVGTEGLTKDKQGTLRFVPKLASIAEEPDGKESLKTAASVHDIASDEEDRELPDHSSDESAAESVVNKDPPPALEPDVWSCSTISKVLKKVDWVIQQTTSSAAKRSEFGVWSKKLDYDGPSLIAGHGICWNIKWQSRDRAYRGRSIINKLINNEKDRHDHDDGKKFFKDVEISRREWEIVNKLNEIISVSF
ncbi:hypothetical protein PCASD_04746 [Puccinia coronata f. sp. avenae]|uniref:Uncharacterized protein n=1 Tax=Puccinia coronata f. sp. avenae TaxID=200324 RepID=A0A2N5V735_9BASI|nr:hypothetical protein PCASD_04746 [Puccinia coronata f. sp. avenae]